jgi:site-specific DNA recombinase
MTTKYSNQKAKAIIFARVSTKDQEDGHSLDAQIQHCYKYAIDNDFSVLETFKIIESATKSKRPEFAKMVNFIRKHKEKIVVLVYNTDRLQRDFDEQALILQRLVKEDRAEIHYTFSGQIINSKADSSTKFRHGLDVLLASDYANKISDNVLRSINKKLEDGTILGPAPIGYLNKERKHFNGQNKHKREQAHVFIDPVRGEIIKKVFEDYATGVLSMKQVLAKALKAGLKGKIKNVAPRVGTIERILSNPFYYGVMKYNGEMYPHPYEPLITKELFDACQDVRDVVKEGIRSKPLRVALNTHTRD